MAIRLAPPPGQPMARVDVERRAAAAGGVVATPLSGRLRILIV